MIRYYIDPNQQTSYWLDFELTKKYPLITKQKRVYLEILDRNSLYTKVKLYLDDGMIVNCFLPRVWYNPIQISNFDDLLDGRFND
jgi:hypothetical protein